MISLVAQLDLVITGQRRREGDEKRARQHFMGPLEYYHKALEKDVSNVYASNGLGAAVAEIGELDATKEIFTDVSFHSRQAMYFVCDTASLLLLLLCT